MMIIEVLVGYGIKKELNDKSKILKLKKFSIYQIDGYVIPKNDEFFLNLINLTG